MQMPGDWPGVMLGSLGGCEQGVPQHNNGERFWEMFTSVGCVVGLWSTTHTSSGSVLNTYHRFVYMQRVYTCYTSEITNQCYSAKITLCSLAGDCHTPLSQHCALARVGH